MSRAEQAGRRLGETINEMAHLMYNEKTKQNFFDGLDTVIGRESVCFTCYRKTSCKHYGVVLECTDRQPEGKTI